MAVNIWIALQGIISLRTNRSPDHPCPAVETLIDVARSAQAGLDHAT